MPEAPVDHEKLQKPPKILLEIGHSVRSLAAHSPMRFGPDLKYIGIELPDNNREAYNGREAQERDLDAYREAVLAKRKGENIEYLTGDARHLDLENDSVDTVFMANVTDSPLLVDGTPAFDQLMLEAWRVLSTDGELVVYEDRTPMGEAWKMKMFELLGFEVKEKVEFGKDEEQNKKFKELERKYGMHVNLTLSKGTDGEQNQRLINSSVSDDAGQERYSIKGDYFMFLSKSAPSQLVPGETQTAYDISLKEHARFEVEKSTKEFEEQREKERRAKYKREKEMKELKKQLAIEVGKLAGKSIIRRAGQIAKRLRDK